MLSAMMLSAIMLNVFMPNVMVPCEHALKQQISWSCCEEKSLRNVKNQHYFIV
jgi:hypothetical protein